MNLQERHSRAVHRAAEVAEAEGQHRFAESLEVFFAGLTVPEVRELLAEQGIRFAPRARKVELLSELRESHGIV